jgi:putative ABC transport system ATP-binding protein
MNHRPAELSGGERQRVAIARSLVNNPEIIVADEPTGNVDSKTGEIIMNILKDLNKRGRTIIVVTHDAELQRFASKVIKIKDGELDDK